MLSCELRELNFRDEFCVLIVLAALSCQAQSRIRPCPGRFKSIRDTDQLFPPLYPPLARQARITGDVRVQLFIRQDGTIKSSEVVSGHPMLKPAALDSAQNQNFGAGDAAIN